MVMDEVCDNTYVCWGNTVLTYVSKSVSISLTYRRASKIIVIQEFIRRRKGLLVITGDMARGQA